MQVVGLVVWSALVAAATPPASADAGQVEEGVDFDTLVDAMTIEDLLTVPVAGTLAASRKKVSPVSVTTITADDIRRTPARNLMDLLEVYVPGALFMHHSDGLQYGIRGIISDRKNKILVLVNGRDVGIKAHGGDSADTEAWDLADIEKIEIVRGPGSVTYGPGAIAGVINITTKTAEQARGARAWTQFLSAYNAVGGGVSYGGESGALAYSFYAGVTYSAGVERPRAFDVRGNGNFGYVGYPAGEGGLDTVPSNEYYSTLRAGRSSPMVKAGVNLKFGEHWRAWARYVESGSAFSPQAKAQLGTTTPLRQEYVVGNSRENRQAMATLENDLPVGSFLALKSAIGVMSSDAELRSVRAFSSDPENGSNFLLNFAEHGVFARSVASFAFLETYSIAVGGEYRYTAWTPGWFDRPQAFVMGDNQNIVNGRDSDRVRTQGVNPAVLIMTGDRGWGVRRGQPRLSPPLHRRRVGSVRLQHLLGQRPVLTAPGHRL
jgi:outer membrane receptor protein involved in Fe transport